MKWKLVGIIFLMAQIALAELPYAEHGFSKREAAAHMLARFSYGARPGEVDKVARMGLEKWLDRQLRADLPEEELNQKLAILPPAYSMDEKQLLATYPNPNEVRKMLQEKGFTKDDGKPDYKKAKDMLVEAGFRPPRELLLTLFGQRLLHARYSENTLREVLTDFWFNHFNVAASNNRARRYMLGYERDAIRPNALGDFRTLLGATARHPAMLLYLDNANSTANKDQMTTAEMKMGEMSVPPERKKNLQKRFNRRKKGLNENYARELMELHTLGVDGGYTQQDVVEVARAFTGWTILAPKMKKMVEDNRAMGEALGMEQEGGFLFAALTHDAGRKKILGHDFPAGGGVEEGERVLDILTRHPSTAHHIAQKLAVRFISDSPAEADIKEIEKAFRSSNGDIKTVVKALARTDGFWDRKNLNAKVKTPFELVVSASRALEGELYPSFALYGWLAKMGHPLYNYQAPTGFPDKAEFWVSSSTVLNRVNFGLHAARGWVPGFTYPARENSDMYRALDLLLPERHDAKTEQTIKSLMANPENLKLERISKFEARPNLGGRIDGQEIPRMTLTPDQQRAATLVGLIIGTPEFQRR